MKKYILIILVTAGWVSACETKPYLKHEIKFKKIREDCNGMDAAFRMNSNINGERYEFQRCLDTDFSKDKFQSLRRGDTVELHFDRTGTQQALYDIIIDIDSYPRYNFLTIDGETFPIIPAGN